MKDEIKDEVNMLNNNEEVKSTEKINSRLKESQRNESIIKYWEDNKDRNLGLNEIAVHFSMSRFDILEVLNKHEAFKIWRKERKKSGHINF